MSSPIFNSHFSTSIFQLLLLLLLLAPTPAFAHKLHVFALANGSTIEGEVYAAGNSPIRDAAVRVRGPDGTTLGQVKSDAEGKFRFEAQQRVDHTFVVEADEGHTAKYTVSADELPTRLPGATPAGKPSAEVQQKLITTADPPVARLPAITSGAAEIEKELEAIHAQVLQLRKQLDVYERKVRLHDVLGGLGMIFGLMGVSFYFLARRKMNDR